ncbi:MAG: hypothetical protein WAV26_01605 [Candidatus Deferrimicrobium sp.]
MNVAKVTLFAVLSALVAVGVSTTSYAFHSGGVAECGGCHSMHSPAAGGSFLLVGTDQSSACLSCHEHAGDTGPSSYHISTADADMPVGTAPLQRTPGGDFGWLKKTYTFVVRGTTNVEDGATHGHNIVAVDKGYAADATNTTAPGGTFPAANLACNSCHDPHGKYRRDSAGAVSNTGAPIIASGSYDTSVTPAAGQAVGVYRLLAGAGYTKSGSTFPGVPAAKTPATYNRTEAATQTRTAYGVASTNGHATWGNWCGTCHGDMHSSGNYVHPVDQSLGSTIAGIYASYVKSGDMTGTLASSFTSLVPFSTNSSDYTVLAGLAKNDGSQLGGPVSTDQVNCLSCHRAHATGFPEMLRWNLENEFMVKNGIYQTTERGRSTAEAAAGYYDRPVTQFASYQRVLCNKCHAQD